MSSTSSIGTNEGLSNELDILDYQTDGLGQGFELRRHKHEIEADEGSREARLDWTQLIGPLHDIPGGCNPFSGHFGSLVLPTCLPERLRIVSYIFEFAFLHDVILESAAQASADQNADESDDFASQGLETEIRSTINSKQIQSKMVLELSKIDPACAEVVTEAWKEMVATTSHRDKNIPFANMDEYLKYRIVDTGAPFVDKLMCFGMGMILDEAESAQVKDIAHAAYATLGLANDYFSFDVEYDEFSRSGKKAMTNVVWLFMNWHGLDMKKAKGKARNTARKYELEFLSLKQQALSKLSVKLQGYVQGLAYQISGNVVWSTDNPRYHPDKDIYRNDMTDFDRSMAVYTGNENGEYVTEALPMSIGRSSGSIHSKSRRSSDDHSSESQLAMTERGSISSSHTSLSDLVQPEDQEESNEQPTHITCEKDVITAPYEYINSLPSKGARESFIDALVSWLPTPREKINEIKEAIKLLHNISLMLDDVEDGSELRRGRPSTHMIFGAPQTINSAGFFVLETLQKLKGLGMSCVELAMTHIQDLYLGQGLDLYWTRQSICPNESEYLRMVDLKTGRLFGLAAHLLQVVGSREDLDIEPFTCRLGRLFQIRDDYQNLVDRTYTEQKGFCEDLDEGKYSFPLIHALHQDKAGKMQLEALLESRKWNGGLTKEAKLLILNHLDKSGSMEYTAITLDGLHEQAEVELRRLELKTGSINWIMRLLLHKLKL